jgi:hypothetical protein
MAPHTITVASALKGMEKAEESITGLLGANRKGSGPRLAIKGSFITNGATSFP